MLPVLLQTHAGLSAAYLHFRELKSREVLLAVLRYFVEHPDDLNSIRAEGYVEPILKLIPRYFDANIAHLVVDILDQIEANHIYPDRKGSFRKLFEIVVGADLDGRVSRMYFEGTIARGQSARRRMHYVNRMLADLMRPATAAWLIENREMEIIQQLAPYLQGEVRELLRPHSDGIIDEQDAAALQYRNEEAEAERAKRNGIAIVQDRLLSRRTLNEALSDFSELNSSHWPELPESFRLWLAAEISLRLSQLELERSIIWKGNSLWEPGVLHLLLQIVDRYGLRIVPDNPLVFVAMSVNRNTVANHCQRFGFSAPAQQALEHLLSHPPSTQALNELVSFVERAQVWSEEIDGALRGVVANSAEKEHTQITALRLVAQHGADDPFISGIELQGSSEQLRRSALDILIERNHRPTIERSLARLLRDETELRRGEVPIPYDSPLDWIAKIRTDFALTRLIELRERALRLELSRVTQLLSNTIGKINRRELVEVIRRQLDLVPTKWRRWQQSQALEQERTARIEEAQRTPFDEVIRKLKGATSLNRLIVMCEGATDIPVFEQLVGQCGEVPDIHFSDVGGWSGLRNKDPNFFLLGSKAVIVVMDGDEGRKLSKRAKPLTAIAREQRSRLARYGIDLRVLQRYGIENYFPQVAIESVLGIGLSGYFPIPENTPVTEHLSQDSKGLWYRFRRWVASALDLKMPPPRQSLYSKKHNRAVAELISLNKDLAGTDLREIIQSIGNRARELLRE